MGVVFNPAGEYAAELRKWEQHHTQYSIDVDGESRPGNPESKRSAFDRAFPKMLYMAHKNSGGQYCTGEVPDPYADDNAQRRAAELSKKCQKIVRNEDELIKALNQGWRVLQEDAIAYAEEREIARAQATAERHFSDKKMSAKAQAEAAAHDAATFEQQPEVPRTPIKRRGRPVKVKEPVGG